MSYETTNARIELEATLTAWNQHRAHCARCGGPGRPDLCPAGIGLRAARKAAESGLKRQKLLDEQPPAGQLPLW